jgi:primosomal protein N' (replication factor Y)
LVQHISNKGYYLACHHCGFHQDGLAGCPSCKSPFMRQLGLGTQRIEEEIHNAFPDAKVLRMDSDISSKRGAQELIMSKFANGEADILIGTQMVAKGLDIHNVTTVGVLSADSLFNLPDFRSAERGFQLLTQVSGRAGRGQKEGKVVWQLYSNCIQPIQYALNHDYDNFAITELESRVSFSYPPYSQLIRLIISSIDNELALAQAERLAEELSSVLEDSVEPDKVIILGPSPCLIEKLKGLYRHQILIKNLAGKPGHHLITQYLKSKEIKEDIRLAIDIDPYDLL